LIVRQYYKDTITGEEYFYIRSEKLDFLVRKGEENLYLERDVEDIFFDTATKKNIRLLEKETKRIALQSLYKGQEPTLVSKFNTYYHEMMEYSKILKKEKRRRRI
jgi:hypothetical protein